MSNIAPNSDDPLPLLELHDIVKTFPGGVVANDHVNLSVRDGEVHGLLGENGAGKTTLMRILYGLSTPDRGDIILRGEPVTIETPGKAIDLGIGMVHQEFKLIPRLSVVENVILGKHSRHSDADGNNRSTRRTIGGYRDSVWFNLATARDRVAEIADRHEIKINPGATISELEVGQRQQVEILKALYRDVDLLILDEPTAALSPRQIERLFGTIEQLVSSGLSVIFITHKLREVTAITDRVTVLRNGSVVGTVTTGSVSRADLAQMMVGREVIFQTEREASAIGAPLLSVSNLHAEDDRGVEVVKNVTFDVHEKEILGVAGVSGNGQTQLAECLAGCRKPTEGTVEIPAGDLTGCSARSFIDSGISYIPEDRIKHGCAPDISVMHNIILKDYREMKNGPFLDYDSARKYAEHLVEEFDVRVPHIDVTTGKLSGGNLQKLILARELSRDPDVIVASKPTRGLDVGAIEYIRELLLQQRNDGKGILLVSENLDEILELSDRILVMYEGEIVHETTNENADREAIGRFMTEGSAEEKIQQ